jgi:hypothetical protein
MAGKAGSETARVEEWQGMFWLLQLTDSAAGHHLLENRLAWMIKPACEASSHQEGMKLEYFDHTYIWYPKWSCDHFWCWPYSP